jgi:hypothetical protein
MLETVMLTPRGRVAQLEEPLLNKQMVGWDWILAQTIEKKCSGAPGETRTPDPLLRRQTLYPTELRAH